MPTEEQKLQKFVSELEGLLEDFRSNKIVNEQSKRHQKQLEKLLGQTNKILARDASKEELKQFNELTKWVQQSFKELKRNTRNNEEFNAEFKKTFGGDVGAGSVNKRLMKSMASSMADVARSVNMMSGQLKSDVKDTGLNFLTGPFGKILEESVDTSGIKDAVKRRFSRSKPQGQFDDGVRSVPRRGTYILDQNERVLNPEENNDLSRFLDRAMSFQPEQKEKERAIRIMNESMAKTFSDPIIDQRENLHSDLISVLKTNHIETIRGLRSIRSAIFVTMERATNTWFEKIDVAFDRFMRHPMWNSMLVAMRPLSFTMRTIKNTLIGRRKTETQQLKESVDKIYEFLRFGAVESRATGFRQFIHFMTGMQALEDRAAQGKKLNAIQSFLLRNSQGMVTQHARAGGIYGRRGPMVRPESIEMADRLQQQRSRTRGWLTKDLRPAGTQMALRSRLLAGDENREQDQAEEDLRSMTESVVNIETILEWIKEAMKGMTSGGFGGNNEGTSFYGVIPSTAPMKLLKWMGKYGLPAIGGYMLGSWFNDNFIKGTPLGEAIGQVSTMVAALLGIRTAQEALLAEWRKTKKENKEREKRAIEGITTENFGGMNRSERAAFAGRQGWSFKEQQAFVQDGKIPLRIRAQQQNLPGAHPETEVGRLMRQQNELLKSIKEQFPYLAGEFRDTMKENNKQQMGPLSDTRPDQGFGGATDLMLEGLFGGN